MSNLLCTAPLSCSEGFTELGYYNGTVSQTDSGAPCLKWTDFPDYVTQYPGRGLGQHSYCRNPDRESNPWCFFRQNSGAIGWAYCDCHQGRTRVREAAPAGARAASEPSRLPFRCSASGGRRLFQRACGSLLEQPVGGRVQLPLVRQRRQRGLQTAGAGVG